MAMEMPMIIWMIRFMSPFIIYVIDHIQNNFERFTTQEGNCGDIYEVNFEQVAALLVNYSENFRK
jgi:hypothetical protein